VCLACDESSCRRGLTGHDKFRRHPPVIDWTGETVIRRSSEPCTKFAHMITGSKRSSNMFMERITADLFVTRRLEWIEPCTQRVRFINWWQFLLPFRNTVLFYRNTNVSTPRIFIVSRALCIFLRAGSGIRPCARVVASLKRQKFHLASASCREGCGSHCHSLDLLAFQHAKP